MTTSAPLTVGLVQLAVVDGEPARNVERAASLIASAPAADLYLLPELWTTGYAHATWRAVARGHTPEAVDAMRAMAAARGAWVGGSLITETDDGALANRLLARRPGQRGDGLLRQGAPVRADGASLQHLVGGDARACARASAAARRRSTRRSASASTCASRSSTAATPPTARSCSRCVAEWPDPRGDALRLFARARAAENQAYLALCNRVGPAADGTRFCGGSRARRAGRRGARRRGRARRRSSWATVDARVVRPLPRASSRCSACASRASTTSGRAGMRHVDALSPGYTACAPHRATTGSSA